MDYPPAALKHTHLGCLWLTRPGSLRRTENGKVVVWDIAEAWTFSLEALHTWGQRGMKVQQDGQRAALCCCCLTIYPRALHLNQLRKYAIKTFLHIMETSRCQSVGMLSFEYLETIYNLAVGSLKQGGWILAKPLLGEGHLYPEPPLG